MSKRCDMSECQRLGTKRWQIEGIDLLICRQCHKVALALSPPAPEKEQEKFHPPIPFGQIPEIKAIWVTNKSSRHLYEYMERLPRQNDHQIAFANRMKLAPKENIGRKFPSVIMNSIAQEIRPHVFAILQMFDGTAAVLTVKEVVDEER